MGACTSILTPPYGYYVRLLFGKGQSIERDLTLSQQTQNFRSGGNGRLKYLGWDRQVRSDNYQRSSQYSSQGRSWPTGISYNPPHLWTGQLILNPTEWELLTDMYELQQASMKAGLTEQDILLYDHRIMFKSDAVTRPEFDPIEAIATPGMIQYWALFRTELQKIDLIEMSKLPSTGNYRYIVNIELKERLPVLSALP